MWFDLEALIKEIIDYFNNKHRKYEIIVVNDGSSDETGKVADTLASKYENFSIVHHTQNKGYGKSTVSYKSIPSTIKNLFSLYREIKDLKKKEFYKTLNI